MLGNINTARFLSFAQVAYNCNNSALPHRSLYYFCYIENQLSNKTVSNCLTILSFSTKSTLMLGLYLYTLKIGQKSCNMLSLLNKLLLQKELQTLWQIMCFWTKSKNTSTTKQKKSNIKTFAGAGNWTRDLLHPKRMRYHCTTESIESINCSQAI